MYVYVTCSFREYLWKFFYPVNYEELVPTPVPEPGQTRQFKQFEFRINILAEATIDFLFTKDKVNIITVNG